MTDKMSDIKNEIENARRSAKSHHSSDGLLRVEIFSLLSTIESLQEQIKGKSVQDWAIYHTQELKLEEAKELIETLQEKEQEFMRSLAAEASKNANLEKRMKDYERQAVENMVRYEESQDVVESQKEEIEQLKFNLDIHIKAVNVEYETQSEIESLKAITELAVKGLEWYADRNNYSRIWTAPDDSELYSSADSDQGIKARLTLSEIERLSQ